MADASPKTQITYHAKPGKFFLYKTAMVTIFLIILPLFPSVAPDFMNQTLHARSWEFLQLIFVGIAVSYGLFSKKNEEPHMDNTQAYVSKLLQVSSVFDDESDNQTVIEETNKMEALNSQYYRGEPVVVVARAKENSSAKVTDGVVSQMINQKPLLLPVRSLKHRLPSSDFCDDSGGISSQARTSRFSNSNSNSSRKLRNEDDGVVLRSPIPWRSRSGRMEMKEDGDGLSASPSQVLNWDKQPRSLIGSSSSRANAEKSVSPPPPAPPPPPPPPFLEKSSSTIGRKPSSEKVLRRSVRSVPSEKEMNSRAEVRLGVRNSDVSMKSVRKLRPDEEEKEVEKESDSFVEKRVKEEEVEEEKEFRRDKAAAAEEERFKDEEGSSSNVDKKADEFIAKFREQIRLQRIESIRRSTAQRAGKSLR